MRGEATIFTNNTFSENRVKAAGGAMLLEDPGAVLIEGNRFFNNSADLPAPSVSEQTGGAVFYSCNPDEEKECDVILTGNNFTNNYATNKGGALRWVNKNFTSTEDKYHDHLGRILQAS